MIGFAGLSHLGIVSSAAAAAKGFDVVAFDTDSVRCAELAEGKFPVHEDGLAELVAANRQRLKYTSSIEDLRACAAIYISRDVPTDADNKSDTQPLVELTRNVAEHAADGAIIVVLSQVNPGFTRDLSIVLRDVIERKKLRLFYQVETLIFGSAVTRAMRPERYMIGCADPAAEIPQPLKALLEAFGCPIFRMGYESAEFAKISINFFLVASVTTTNTLAELCEKIGANWSEIAPTLRLDARIGPHAYLSPGLGIAGGNLERDLATYMELAARHGADDSLPRTFFSHSANRKTWVLRMLHDLVLSRVPDPQIAVWGLAYKPNTKFVKNAPSIELLQALRGVKVKLYDPQARLEEALPHVTEASSALEACRGAHALVIMTAWDEFKKMSPTQVAPLLVKGAPVIDPSAAWKAADVQSAGLGYLTLGAKRLVH